MQPCPIVHPLMTLALVVIVPYIWYVIAETRRVFKTRKTTKASESEFARRFREAQTLYKTR